MKPIYYVVCPGWVQSKNDGQRHYIGFDELMMLYGLSHRTHDVHLEPNAPWEWHGWNPPANAVYLRPRYDGNYKRMPTYEGYARNDE